MSREKVRRRRRRGKIRGRGPKCSRSGCKKKTIKKFKKKGTEASVKEGTQNTVGIMLFLIILIYRS